MKLKQLKNIYIIEAETQYELAISFMRLEEFYESSFSEIRNNYFTTEQYMDRYAKEFGNFTYTSDWDGFNVPGHVVRQFFTTFKDLTDHEKELKELIEPAFKKPTSFYVIGSYGKGRKSKKIIDHELAHALYYINVAYPAAMNSIINDMSEFNYRSMKKTLLKMGYSNGVVDDEIQAYLSTSSYWYIIKTFKCLPLKTIKEMRATFSYHKRQHKK